MAVTTFVPVGEIHAHTENHICSIEVSPCEAFMAITCRYNAFVADIITRRVMWGTEYAVSCCMWSPSGCMLAFVNSEPWSDGTIIEVMDARSSKCLQMLKGHTDRVNSVAWAPCGNRLASGSRDKTTKLWDAKTGECLRTLSGHTSNVRYVVWSPSGDLLASVNSRLMSGKAIIEVWDTKTGECLQMLIDHHRHWEHSVAWAPCGDMLASRTDDHSIKVWDARSGECLQTLKGHTYNIHNIAWSPSGDMLATGSSDGTVKVWDAKMGECLQTLGGYSSWGKSVAWAPSGDLLTYIGDMYAMNVWDTKSDKCQTLCRVGKLYYMRWSPSGDMLMSAVDNTVKIWLRLKRK